MGRTTYEVYNVSANKKIREEDMSKVLTLAVFETLEILNFLGDNPEFCRRIDNSLKIMKVRVGLSFRNLGSNTVLSFLCLLDLLPLA